MRRPLARCRPLGPRTRACVYVQFRVNDCPLLPAPYLLRGIIIILKHGHDVTSKNIYVLRSLYTLWSLSQAPQYLFVLFDNIVFVHTTHVILKFRTRLEVSERYKYIRLISNVIDNHLTTVTARRRRRQYSNIFTLCAISCR